MTPLNINKFVFCFPYKKIGGVCVLFLRMAEYLVAHYPIEVSLVDYPDGYMTKNVTDARIKLITYYDDQKVDIPENVLLVFQSMTPWSIFPSLSIPVVTKLFFWTCHPLNFAITLPSRFIRLYQYPRIYSLIYRLFFASYRHKIVKFINLCLKKNALYFMDGSVVKSTKDLVGFNFKVPSEYLPIPCLPSKNIFIEKNFIAKDFVPFQITWIGRLVDFKIYMLITAIADIKQYAETSKRSILISIIGDGDKKSLVEKYAGGNQYCKIEFLGQMSLSSIDNFLEKTDLLLAMGTSALEGARTGVPTILVDISYKMLSSYNGFKFLYQSEDYSLGEILSPESFIQKKGNTMIDLVNQTMKNYNIISQKTHDYCANNFFIGKVCEKFMQFSSKTTLTYEQLLNVNVMKRGILYRIYKSLKSKM